MPKLKPIYLKDYQPADFSIDTVHLHFDCYDDHVDVTTLLSIARNPDAKRPNAPLVLNGEAMVLQKVLLDGKELIETAYQCDDKSLTIADVPDKFVLETKVIIKPKENKALSGLYQSRGNLCTQCEAHGFRRITYYLDRPDVMARFTTTITADQNQFPMLLSNGNLIESKQLADKRHWVHWEDPSLKPAYLFALVAGDFDLLEDAFTTQSGRKICLQLYLEKGYKDQGHYALDALKKAMHWDEKTYGREYDLDIYMIVAVSDFNMGAMENKGLNIFNTKYILAKPDLATDQDYVAIEGVIGHEYFHNWSGNRITCRDWFQITLKEGLTVFRDQHFTEDMTSQAVARIDNINVVRNQQFSEDAGPTAHPIRPESYIEVNNFYTLTVYRKGSEVIRMIRTLIGKDTFRKGMDLYFQRFDGQAVTTEDFVGAMESASDKNLTQFKRWYAQAGTPLLTIHSKYDSKSQTLILTVQQSCPPTPGQKNKKPFHLPLAVGFVGKSCCDMPTRLSSENQTVSGTRILEITESKQTFKFIDVAEKPVISLLRDFSAPVKVVYAYSDDELLWLWQCDSDPYTRWDAGQQVMQRMLFHLVKSIQSGDPLQCDPRIFEAIRIILEEDMSDLRFKAKLITLPAISYLIQQMSVIDIEALYQAYQFIKKKISVVLHDVLINIYHRVEKSSYIFNMEAMGERSLKNLSLSYLMAAEKEDYFQLAYQQFSTSDNMTDMIGALSALNNYASELRKKALDAFYTKWQDQPGVVNKWLMLQATSTLPHTLLAVKKLLTHSAYDSHNPNNVYALIGGFGANLVSFHEKSGAGYQFLADQVLSLDSDNPQVASRMLMPLTRWQHFDTARQNKIKTELQRILKAESLSPDVYEIASKSLEDH